MKIAAHVRVKRDHFEVDRARTYPPTFRRVDGSRAVKPRYYKAAQADDRRANDDLSRSALDEVLRNAAGSPRPSDRSVRAPRAVDWLPSLDEVLEQLEEAHISRAAAAREAREYYQEEYTDELLREPAEAELLFESYKEGIDERDVERAHRTVQQDWKDYEVRSGRRAAPDVSALDPWQM